MKPHRLFPSFVLAAAMALAFVAPARAADDNTNTIKFSDPAKPGTLKLQLGRGEIRVRGADVTEVSVKSDAKAMTSKPRKDGLRVIGTSSGFSFFEKDNVVTIESDAMFRGGGSDFTITVPKKTNIIINNMWGGGDVRIADIEGDLEVECPHGEINLERISGGALVTTMNGEIRASVLKLNPNKPLSFASMNGEVQLRLAPDAKATFAIRTQNGTVLTGFDEKALITKMEAAPRSPKAMTLRGKGVLPQEAQDAIAEGTRVAVEAAKMAEQVARETADAVRAGADVARAKARAEADARRSESRDARPPKAPDAPVAAAAPAPAAAPGSPDRRSLASKVTMTGGNLVTGTLNGGGPEISISTMNGDVKILTLETK